MEDLPICPGCGGAFDAHGLCTWCGQGVRFAGRSFDARATAIPCPSCQGTQDTPLWHITYQGVPIEVCPACGGAWLDLGELEQMAQAARAASRDGQFAPSQVDLPEDAPARSRAYLPCPKCRTLMNRVNWEHRSGILVDVCAHHGVWLDAGELARVRTWAAGTPEGPPAPLPQPPPAATKATGPMWWASPVSGARTSALAGPVWRTAAHLLWDLFRL